MKINTLSLFKEQAYIDGRWLGADTGKQLEVTDPAATKVIGTVPNMGKGETARAVEAAAQAFPAWRNLLARERADTMMKWYGLVLQHQKELAQIMVIEQGKPMTEAMGEVAYAASFVRYYAEEGRRAYGEIAPAFRLHAQPRITKEPVGVAGLITPWNFPSAMITRKSAAAIAAGCTCVIKPSDLTPYSAIALICLAEQAGIPPGVLNLITGDAPPIGKELTSNPLVRKISFTGSVPTGKLLMEQSAEQLKKLSLELGGNAPFIIFEDAELEKAIDEVMASKFRNTGQPAYVQIVSMCIKRYTMISLLN